MKWEQEAAVACRRQTYPPQMEAPLEDLVVVKADLARELKGHNVCMEVL